MAWEGFRETEVVCVYVYVRVCVCTWNLKSFVFKIRLIASKFFYSKNKCRY